MGQTQTKSIPEPAKTSEPVTTTNVIEAAIAEVKNTKASQLMARIIPLNVKKQQNK